MPKEPLSLNALSKGNADPEKPHPTAGPLAFEYNYVMQETVGWSRPRLKPLISKLNSPAPIKLQAHQMAAIGLQAVAQHLQGVAPS